MSSNKVVLSKALPRAASMITIIASCVVLFGWQFNVESLQYVFPGLPKMTPNTAVGFILAALSLGLYSWFSPENNARRLAQILAVLVLLLALQTLGEYLFGWNTGLDQLLFEDPAGTLQTPIPGRPSPHTAVAFTFLSSALILLYKDTARRHWIAQYSTLTTLFIALLALVGYTFGISYFFRISTYTGMALHTAVAFIVLCIGLLALCPERGFMTIITANNLGGKMARRLLLMAITVPLVVGWLSVVGAQLAFFPVQFVPVLFMVLSVYVSSAAIWWIARSLNRSESRRQEIEETLRQNEERTRLIVETALDAVITINPHSIIIGWNPQAETIFGWPRHEALGKSLDIILPPKHREAHHQGMHHFVKTGEGPILNQRLEMTALHRDGVVFPVELAVSPIPVKEGFIFNAFIRDLTQQKRLEAQFLQAQKMEAIGQLTAGIAHDFNNLLTVINFNAQFVEMHLPEKDPLYNQIGNILKASSGAADLIRQLLIFSRKQITTPKTVNLNTVITEMSQLLKRVIGENIEVRLQLNTDLWKIQIDPAQAEQVIVNLVLNARDAMPDGGKLILETTNLVLTEMDSTNYFDLQPGEYVLLTVSDTGTGMSQKVQQRLFEPFFTTKAVGKGTGLGLATVYGIIKQREGHIGVYSEEGQGSSFKIYIPRSQDDSEPALPPSPVSEAHGGHETILVVEDEANIRQLITKVLREKAYTVLEAKDGEEALEMAALYTGEIDLLLTDVIMTGISGKALAQNLVEQYAQLKVIYMSGYSDEIISHHGILEPGIVLLEKPFTLSTMMVKVREVLR